MSRGRTIGIALIAVAVATVVPMLLSLVTTAGGSGQGGAAAPVDPAHAAAATASRMAAADIIDVPVRFQVRNTNRSLAPCTTPDGTFEVAGHLTAPSALLTGSGAGVTLYLHDFSTGEWYWRLDVPGYHHAEEMARRGFASVTIDRLGYGASDRVNGFHSCVGAQADVTDQIVGRLRAGDYAVEGLPAAPAFGRVTLAGLGTGAQIAQLATLFGRTDGLVVMGFADMGRTDRFMTRVFGNLSTCMQQVGPDQQPAADGGYSVFDVGATEYRLTNFHDADPAVLAAALPRQSPHPCKEVASQLEAISTDLRTLGTVTVPVLGVYGDSDRLFQDGRAHMALFTSARSTQLVTVPRAGHYMGLERSAPVLHDALAGWLSAPERTGSTERREPASAAHAPARPAEPVPAAPAAAPAQQAPVDIVDVPISFQVQNVNRSLNQCAVDGQPYTVHGYLTGPASLLDAPVPPPVTLYVHGTNTAQWIWRLPVEGYDYVQELAERGHVSVTIDRLGYGENPVPDGFGTCTGGNADIAHQVVGRLRAGEYQVDGRAPTRFGKVFMGGHSSGALVAELVASSFGGIDGIVATGWAGIGITDETARRFFPMFDSCQQGLLAGTPPSPEADGYTYFDATLADFYQAGVSNQVDRRVREAMRSHHVRSPCGVMLSEPIAIMEDLTRLGSIDIPVLLVYGSQDTLRQGVDPYAELFVASPDVSETTIPGAGHIMLIDVNAPIVFDTVAEWLERRGG